MCLFVLPVDSSTMYTYGNTTYESAWIPVSGSTNLVFSVQACSDAFFTLSEVQGNPYMTSYEIALGINGGEVNELRHGVGSTSPGDTYNGQLLDCNTQKDFWVSWVGGNFEFGRGHSFGIDRVLTYFHDTPHDTNAVAITTSNNVKGTWVFDAAVGKI